MFKRLLQLIGIAGLFATAPLAQAACSGATDSFCLKNLQWEMITIPGTLQYPTPPQQLFSNLGTYNTHWFLYRYNSTNDSYEKLGANEIVHPATGYWIIQGSGADEDLTLPNAYQGGLPFKGCSSSSCYDVPLARGSTFNDYGPDTVWTFSGNPNVSAISLSDIRVVEGADFGATDHPPCNASQSSTSCTLSDNNVVQNQIRRWNSATGSMDLLTSPTDLIPGWSGFWVDAIPSFQNNGSAALLLPSVGGSTSSSPCDCANDFESINLPSIIDYQAYHQRPQPQIGPVTTDSFLFNATVFDASAGGNLVDIFIYDLTCVVLDQSDQSQFPVEYSSALSNVEERDSCLSYFNDPILYPRGSGLAF